MKPVLIHRAARMELEEAVAFYESRERGLGLDLQRRVEAEVKVIQQWPEIGPLHKSTVFRKCFTNRFPFTVFYQELADYIWIVAIAHGSRRPDYWKTRMRGGDE